MGDGHVLDYLYLFNPLHTMPGQAAAIMRLCCIGIVPSHTGMHCLGMRPTVVEASVSCSPSDRAWREQQLPPTALLKLLCEVVVVVNLWGNLPSLAKTARHN